MDLDETDQRILAELTADARVTATELARRINLSRPAVQARIARLESSGLIQGYTIIAGPGAKVLRAMIFVTIVARPCAPVLAWLRDMPGVQAVTSLAGDIDAVVEVAVSDTGALTRLGDILAGDRRVAGVRLAPVLSRL